MAERLSNTVCDSVARISVIHSARVDVLYDARSLQLDKSSGFGGWDIVDIYSSSGRYKLNLHLEL